MASVITPGLLAIINLTISAFYLGDIRHAMSTEEEHASFKNYFVILWELIILKRDSPETTVPDFL